MQMSKRLKGKRYAAAQKADKVDVPKTSQKAQTTPRGRIPEVVISSSKSSGSSRRDTHSSPPTSPDAEMSDASSAPSRPVRTSAKRKIVISDDEEDEEEDLPPKKSMGKGKARKIISDEDDDFEDPGEESDAKMDTDDDAVSEASGPATSRASVSSADEMDVDDEEPPAKPEPPKKRKSTAKDEPVTKKAKVADKSKQYKADPWKLRDPKSKRDWTQVHGVPLDMFHFGRIVVDEYTYLNGKVHSLVTKLTSDRKWVLSGTPPVHNFAAVRTIADFLGIHLGVTDGNQIAKLSKKQLGDLTGEQPPCVLLVLVLTCNSCRTLLLVYRCSDARLATQPTRSRATFPR